MSDSSKTILEQVVYIHPLSSFYRIVVFIFQRQQTKLTNMHFATNNFYHEHYELWAIDRHSEASLTKEISLSSTIFTSDLVNVIIIIVQLQYLALICSKGFLTCNKEKRHSFLSYVIYIYHNRTNSFLILIKINNMYSL